MKNPKHPEKYHQSMQNLARIMEKENIRHLIHTGGSLHSGGVNEHWSFGRRLLRFFLVLVWIPGLEAKRLEWEVFK